MPQSIDTQREDPLIGFHFALEFQGQVTGYFTECSGIGSENEVISLENTRSAEVGRYHFETRHHF